MAQNVARTARVEARLAPDTLLLVKRAAKMQGRSVSEFIVESARIAAEDAIDRHQRLLVSVEQYDQIMDALARPPLPGMEKAYAAHKELIRESR